MTKTILILSTVFVALGLTTVDFTNIHKVESSQVNAPSCTAAVDYGMISSVYKPAPDLLYKVEHRFMTTVTKEALDKALSIADILPVRATQGVELYRDVEVSILQNDTEFAETRKGDGATLNASQKSLLHSVNPSANIHIRANYKVQSEATWRIGNDLTYYITVVPDQEATYADGYDAMINYLRNNSREKTAGITREKLKPGKVRFTVAKNGTIKDVKLVSTSGYPLVDDRLVDLVRNMPGKWNPAANSKGEKIDQELVFFFGIEGC